MEFITINLKENNPTVQEAIANLEIAIELYGEMLKGMKIIHGYGSHGKGGNILLELNKFLPLAKKQKKIKDYIKGIDWCFANEKTFKFITSCHEASLDCDLNSGNIGITVLIF